MLRYQKLLCLMFYVFSFLNWITSFWLSTLRKHSLAYFSTGANRILIAQVNMCPDSLILQTYGLLNWLHRNSHAVPFWVFSALFTAFSMIAKSYKRTLARQPGAFCQLQLAGATLFLCALLCEERTGNKFYLGCKWVSRAITLWTFCSVLLIIIRQVMVLQF